MEPTSVFFCGTMMPPVIGSLMNKRITGHWKQSLVKTLPNIGMDDCRNTFQNLGLWLDKNVASDQPLVLGGHSQGGLYAVMLALERSNVQRVVTFSTPHHGTEMAYLALRLGPLGRGLHDMRPSSSFMREYVARLPEIASRLISIYGRHDGLIRPYHSAHVAGARNYLFATPEEFRTIGTHLLDTVWLEGKPNHFTELFDTAVGRALHFIDDADPDAA